MQTQSLTYPDPALSAYLDEYFRTTLQEHLTEQIAAQLQNLVLLNENRSREYALMERMVRVEEELKALRETEGVHFAAIQKEMAVRFEAMNERFEAMNERIAASQKENATRFEAMNERISSFQKENATRFEAIQNDMNTRFEAMQNNMNTRFEAMDKRFDAVDKRFSQLLWTILVGFTMMGALIGWMGHLAR